MSDNAVIDPNFNYDAQVSNTIANNTAEVADKMNALPSYAIPDNGWGSIPKTMDPYGVADLTTDEVLAKAVQDTVTRNTEQKLNIDNARRDIYAMTHGTQKMGAKDAEIQARIAEKKKTYGDLWTDEMSAVEYSNAWKKEYDDLQFYWGADKHVENSTDTLRALTINPNLTPDTLAYLGIAQEVKGENPLNSFTRSRDLSDLTAEIKSNFFNNSTNKQDDIDVQNELAKANWLYKNNDDSSVLSFAGEATDMLTGGIKRTWGGWGQGLLSLGVATALTPFTAGFSLKAWGAYTFAKDMFDTTRADIALGTMALDPSLTKDDAFNDVRNIGVSTSLSLLNTVGMGVATKIAYKAANKFLRIGEMADRTLLTGIDSAAVKTARNKAIQTDVVNAAKNLGISETVNMGIGGLTAVTQQLATNIIGKNQNTWQGVDDAALSGVGMGAAFGAIPAPFSLAGLGFSYRMHTKAMNSALEALNRKAQTSTIENTEAYKKNPVGTATELQELDGFHETKTYININEARAWSKAKGVDIDKTELGQKIQEAEAGGATEISLDLKEQARLKGGRWQQMVDELGKANIDDASPLEIREALSPEEQKKVAQVVAQVKESRQKFEQELEDGGKQISDDMYRELDNAPLEPAQKDAIIGMNMDFFKALSTNYNIPIKELWSDLGMHWNNFEKVLYNDPNNPRPNANLRGNYNPQSGTITLGHGADMATAVHEYGHYALDTLMKLAINRRHAGKEIKALDKALTDTFGADWEKTYTEGGKGLEEMQERFAYQFLDYLAGIENKGSTDVLRSVKHLITTAESRRYAYLKGKEKEFIGAQNQIRDEYKGRFGYDMPKRSDSFDALANSLFKAEQITRRLDDDYGSDSIANIIPEAVLSEKKRLRPEETHTIDEVNREIAENNERAENVLAAELLKQSGYMFSFNDGFLKRWKEFSKDKEVIKKVIEDSKVAKELFRKAREEIKKRLNDGLIGKLYSEIEQNKVRDGKTILEMRKSGLITESEYKALKAKGIIVKEGGHLPEDFYGRVDGIKSREIVRDKRFADMLKMMLEFPSKDELVYAMAMDHVAKDLQARQELTLNNTKLRELFLQKRENNANSNARILSAFTKTPADRVGVIKTVARRLIAGTRLADLKEGDAMRRAKNARRETEHAASKADFKRAAAENRAERVNITIANMITKVRVHIRDQVRKHGKVLSDDKKAARNGYENKILDVARFIASKNNVIRDRKGITLDTLYEYAKEIPEIQDLLTKFKDFLSPNERWLNRTVEDVYNLLDALNEIETAARNYRSAVIDGKRIDFEQKEGQVIDALLYKKYARDKDGHKQGDFILDADGNKVPVKEEISHLVDRKGRAMAEPVTMKQRGLVFGKSVRARLGRVLNWCGKMDGKDGGICSKMLFHLLGDATSKAKHASNETVKSIRTIMTKPKWKAGMVVANELIDRATGAPLAFGSCQGIYGNAGYHLFGFLLHIGNDENWGKMLRSQGWDEKTVMSFINRMIKEGYITRETLQALNDIWALFDKEFNKANEVYYQMNGRYIKKIEPRKTIIDLHDGKPPFELTGGYAPLIADRARNGTHVDPPLKLDTITPADVERSLFAGDATSSNTSFMTERTDKAYYLDFNPTHLLAVAPRVSSYAHIMPAVKAADSFWRRPKIQQALNKVDRQAYSEMIKPYIARALGRSAVVNGDVFGSKLLNRISNAVGMNMMCMNIANTATQLGGIANALQAVKFKYLMESLGASLTDFNELKQEVINASALMRDRIDESSSHLIETVNQITIHTDSAGAWNKTKANWARMSDWQQQHAYFMQKFLQDRIDVAIFKGAYMQEVDRLGKKKMDLTPEEQEHAVHVAEEAVIKTQSSSNSLDKSAMETSNAFTKLLFQFHNYFLTVVNYQTERWGQLKRSDAGAFEKARVMLPFVALGTVIPAYFAEALMMTARGDWQNEDLDDMQRNISLFAFSPIKQYTSAVPLFGDVINGILDGSISNGSSKVTMINSPTFSYLENIINTFNRAVFDGKLDYRLIRATAGALAIALKSPFLAPVFGKSLANFVGITSGQILNNGFADGLRTVVSGSVRSDERNTD